MAFYENVFIVRPDLSTTQVEALANELSEVVQSNGGTVGKTEHWGLRSLAYRIRKNRKGHYVLLNLDAPAEAVRELERRQRIHEDVIRYLTVRVDALEEGPSAMLKSRDDRGRRDSRENRGGFRGSRDGGPRDGGSRDGRSTQDSEGE